MVFMLHHLPLDSFQLFIMKNTAISFTCCFKNNCVPKLGLLTCKLLSVHPDSLTTCPGKQETKAGVRGVLPKTTCQRPENSLWHFLGMSISHTQRTLESIPDTDPQVAPPAYKVRHILSQRLGDPLTQFGDSKLYLFFQAPRAIHQDPYSEQWSSP